MPVTTEIFVMLIFMVGMPFYFYLLRDPELEGCQWFLAAYILLLLSNVATVAEEFFWQQTLNFLEHFLISASSLIFIGAVLHMTGGSGLKDVDASDSGKS